MSCPACENKFRSDFRLSSQGPPTIVSAEGEESGPSPVASFLRRFGTLGLLLMFVLGKAKYLLLIFGKGSSPLLALAVPMVRWGRATLTTLNIDNNCR